MKSIELSSEEASTLREILESTLSDLRMEIAGTDSMDFREGLHRKETFLRSLIDRLAAV